MKKIFTFFVLFLLTATNSTLFAQWELVWQDEFDGSIGSDWVFETGTGDWGWGNNEQQYYRKENASIVNGALRIQARRENYGDKKYTSARLKTQGKRSFKYGKIEARISMPSFMGVWPAFWTLGDDISTPGVGWPACGEIDIMEHVNTGGQIVGTMHWEDLTTNHAEYGGSTSTDITNYHVYSIEWDENYIRWYVDGNKYHEANIANGINGTHEFHNKHFLLLNMAIGGNWPGFNIDDSAFPANMMIDYVRVYKKAGGGNEDPGDVDPPVQNGWDTWFGDGGAGSVVYGGGNLATVTVTNAGWASYSAQLFKDNLDLPDGSYELTFKAKADASRSINVNVGKGLDSAPWFDEFMSPALFNLTSQWKTFTHTFTKSNSYPTGKLVFEVGTATSGTAVTKVYFDEVVLKQTTGTYVKKNSEDQTLSLYPNPAKEMVSVNVKSGSKISLYNISGVLIASKIAYDSATSFDLSGLENGVYFIESLGKTAKFIKE